jgi:hypothetical protein
LERLLFTWAFWHLHSCELVELGHLDDDGDEELTGDDTDEQPGYEIGVSRTQFDDGAYGFEAEVLGACRSDPDPIKMVIRRWALDLRPPPIRPPAGPVAGPLPS